MKINYFMSLRKFFPFVLIALLISALSFTPKTSQATLASYKFKTGSGSMLPSQNVLWSGYQGIRNSGLVSTPLDLGFSFKFDGLVYNQIIVYSSGLISFGSTQSTGPQNPTLANTNVPVVAGFWGGTSPYTGRQSVSLSGGEQAAASWGGTSCGVIPDIEYQVSGSAPNRVMVVTWNNIDITSIESLSTWQIRLYETTNVVEIFYQHMTPTSCGGSGWGTNTVQTSAAIGVANGNNNFISVKPSGGSNATSSTSAASNSIDLQSNPIGDGTLYTFLNPPNEQLSLLPKSLNFGLIIAGTSSAPLCATVQNVGTDATGTLLISSAVITGNSDFTISSSPASNSLPIGTSGQYCIVFKPSTNGIRNALLTVTTNGVDSGTQTVALTGVGAVAEIAVDSLTRFKKTRTRLGDSLTQYVHVTSTGQAALAFSSFTLTGQDAGQYFVSHYPLSPLPVGQTDSVGITYVPTIEGKHVADLIIISNAFTFPSVDINLQGTGTLPHIVLTPTILQFDSTREGDTICKNITIYNPGSDTLKIRTNYLGTNDGDFHYTGLTPDNSNIPPDQTKTVTVCFTPIQQGDRVARLVLTTNIIQTFETPRRDTAGLLTINIGGTGVPFGVFGDSISDTRVPAFLDSAFIGKTVCRTNSLKNTGDADITVTGISINPSNFTISGLPAFPFILKARTALPFTICGTPDVQGLITGTATVSGKTGGATITEVINLGVFGIKACISASPVSLFDGLVLPNNGSDSVICDTITNCGDLDAVYNVAISGTSSADYSVTPSVSGVVNANGGKTVFCVTYKPSAVGPSPASLDITTADNSVSAKVPLNGADGCAVLTNVPPAIPSTGDNNTSTFSFTITNAGAFEWIPNAGQISGPDSAAFVIDSIVPTPIPANGQATVYMHFHPPLGSQGNTLTGKLTWPNAGPCGNALSIDLSGVVVQSSVPPATAMGGFILEQSYPNPSTGITSFAYSTPSETEVRISLLDLTGKLVRTLITGIVSEGYHTVNFDASNLASGTYIYLLQSGSTRLSRQFILAR